MEPTATPLISLPFPARQHPYAEQIEAYTRDWAVRFQLVRTDANVQAMARVHYGDFAGICHPTAPLPEAKLIAAWFAWLFLADDQYEEGSCRAADRWIAVTEAVRHVLEASDGVHPLADTPLIRALADLSHRLNMLVSPVWKKRFTKQTLDTMAGALREIQLREGGTPPGLSAYVALRRNAGAIIPCFDFIEVCAGVELPNEVYYSAIFQEIILAGADIVCWTNDLYSLDKEIASGSVANLVLVLQHERRLDREQAFHAARDLIGKRVNDLLAAEQRLPELTHAMQLDTSTQEAVRRCVEGVKDWIAGSNQWHANGTTRYQRPSLGTPASSVEDLLVPRSVA